MTAAELRAYFTLAPESFIRRNSDRPPPPTPSIPAKLPPAGPTDAKSQKPRKSQGKAVSGQKRIRQRAEEAPFLGSVPEYRFAPPRRWRFDYAWPAHKVALEVEGGVWTGGRHTRAVGFMKDMEKYNEAACLGWRIVRVVPTELHSQKTKALIMRMLP